MNLSTIRSVICSILFILDALFRVKILFPTKIFINLSASNICLFYTKNTVDLLHILATVVQKLLSTNVLLD